MSLSGAVFLPGSVSSRLIRKKLPVWTMWQSGSFKGGFGSEPFGIGMTRYLAEITEVGGAYFSSQFEGIWSIMVAQSVVAGVCVLHTCWQDQEAESPRPDQRWVAFQQPGPTS